MQNTMLVGGGMAAGGKILNEDLGRKIETGERKKRENLI